MKKRSLIVMLAIVLVFAAAILPQRSVNAKAKAKKCWYGKYSEYAKDAKKAITFKKGGKVKLKGKFTFTTKRFAGDAKERKVNKTIKLAKGVKYYIEDTNAEKDAIKKVSKKEFKKAVYSDVSHAAFKVKKGRIVIGIVSLN